MASCGLFGFFAFALMPVCLEVGVECTYPVAEATSAGLQWMAGYCGYCLLKILQHLQRLQSALSKMDATLSVLERCLSNREFIYSEMSEK